MGQPPVCELLLRVGGELPTLKILPGVRESWESVQVAMGRFSALAATEYGKWEIRAGRPDLSVRRGIAKKLAPYHVSSELHQRYLVKKIWGRDAAGGEGGNDQMGSRQP